MKLRDIDLYEVGNSIGLAGAIYADENTTYFCFFPDAQDAAERLTKKISGSFTEHRLERLDMDSGDWERFLRQTDLLETVNPITKAILRKSQRQIDAVIQWAVFRRDQYTCRYCGKNDAPLTVDHLVLWEENGPSVEANLVAACRKCNKTRGRMQYEDWLRSDYYRQVSQNLTSLVRADNELLVKTLASIPRVQKQRSR